MNRSLLAAALATAVLVPATVALASVTVIQERQAGFRMMRDNMEAIQAVVQARRPNADAVAPARAIAEHGQQITRLFPPGSDQGAETRALPSIWSDRSGFESRADAFATQAQALLAAAQGGDQAALARAFEATGGTCGACHWPHRAAQRCDARAVSTRVETAL
uniref:cytochrome c n=1 Tax=Elioraea sp. TaxID=2185103 RepID=UPI003F70EE3F